MRLWAKVTGAVVVTGWVLYFTIYLSIPRQRIVIPVSRWWKEQASSRKRTPPGPLNYTQTDPHVIASPLDPPPGPWATYSLPATAVAQPESRPSVAVFNSTPSEHAGTGSLGLHVIDFPLEANRRTSVPNNLSDPQETHTPRGNSPDLSAAAQNNLVEIGKSNNKALDLSQHSMPLMNQAALPSSVGHSSVSRQENDKLSGLQGGNSPQTFGSQDEMMSTQSGYPLPPAENISALENAVHKENLSDQELNDVVKELLDKNTREAFLQMFGQQDLGLHTVFKRHWRNEFSSKDSAVLNKMVMEQLLENIKRNMLRRIESRVEESGNALEQNSSQVLRNEAYSALNETVSVQADSKQLSNDTGNRLACNQQRNFSQTFGSQDETLNNFLRRAWQQAFPSETQLTLQNTTEKPNVTNEQIIDKISKLIDDKKEAFSRILGPQQEKNQTISEQYWQMFFTGKSDPNETTTSTLFDNMKENVLRMLRSQNESAIKMLGQYMGQFSAANQQTLNKTVAAQNASEFDQQSANADIYSNIRQSTLAAYFREKGMNANEGLGKHPAVPMSEVEQFYLDSPALENETFIPDELESEVTLLSTKDAYKVGDKIQLRVDLRDLLGRTRKAGGDEVRVWLKSPGHGSAVAAEVSDLGNGSYLGEATLKWAGLTYVHASLTYPREFLRLCVELRHSLLATRWITAKFKSEYTEEVTPCLPSTPIPGYACTCNFTLENGLSPWFCGQPTDPELSCGHMIHTEYLPPFSPLPLDGPARYMNLDMNNASRELRLIPNDISISTLSGPPAPQLPPCWSRPKRESWELPAHGGWMLKPGVWIPDNCALPDYTSQRLRTCLRNTTVLMLGDSNLRILFEGLRKDLNLTKSVFWFGQKFAKIPWLNSTLLFAVHAHPFHSGHLYPVIRPVSVGRALASLPVDHQYIIVLHYYLHFAFYPMAVFIDRVRSAKRAVVEFLHTHPTAKVFIRGPHVVYSGQDTHATSGDKFGPWFLQILKQEFQDLNDRIWLLDFWPMTIASANMNAHPPDYLTHQILSVLLGYACDAS